MDTVETAICELEQEVRRQMAPQSYKVAGAETAKETLTLISSDAESVQRFIECAIKDSLKNLETSIPILEQEMRTFETKYGMSSAEFLRRFWEDEIPETLETIDWCFSCRQYEHLRHTIRLLRAVSFGD